jgi:hypothetical protein
MEGFGACFAPKPFTLAENRVAKGERPLLTANVSQLQVHRMVQGDAYRGLDSRSNRCCII